MIKKSYARNTAAVRFIHVVRELRPAKPPGVAETLDLSRALVFLEKEKLDEQAVEETLGCILKSSEDFTKIRAEGVHQLLSRAF